MCKSLIFKGGTALKRCYFSKYRFSEDLDFTLAEEMPLETILSEFVKVCAEVRQSSGVVIRYSRKDRIKHQSSHTFYLAYEGPLPGVSKKEFKVDITINERIVMPIQELPVLKGYDEYADLPGNANIHVYALEEILVEKIVALTDFARNEPRDLYDVWYLTAIENMDLTALVPKVASKLEFRDRALAEMDNEFVKKEARLRKLWQVRLANQMAALPHFDEVYRAVRRSLRVAGLMRG
ncbi:MAG: nucleotidyl transferase AbiEii/AbiGii toxin family protein [Desulfobacterales bacterium]|nr:nucleotidyl transferase AbiEii/AbiGii toxin family protein [Desulfobacterales bacterium]